MSNASTLIFLHHSLQSVPSSASAPSKIPSHSFSPPLTETHNTLTRTPSPVREGPDSDVPMPYFSLVSSCRAHWEQASRNGILIATTHLRALLGEYNLQHPIEPSVLSLGMNATPLTTTLSLSTQLLLNTAGLTC